MDDGQRMLAPFVVYGLVETRPSHRYHGTVRYVGQTCNLRARIKAYRRGRGNNSRHTYWLKACPNFDVVVLKQCNTLEEVLSAEINFISLCGTYKTERGLNMHPGGTFVVLGPKSKTHAQAISDGLKGRTFTDEHKRNISSSKTGVKQKAEHIAKRSAATKGVPKTSEHVAKVAKALRNNPEVVEKLRTMGKNKTPEHLAKLRQVASSKNWQCGECDLKSNAGGIGAHQKRSNHVGRHLTSGG